jgi:hypothetical protein
MPHHPKNPGIKPGASLPTPIRKYKFNWEMCHCEGTVRASDMQDALKQIIDIYFTFPYPGDEFVSITIKCQKTNQ